MSLAARKFWPGPFLRNVLGILLSGLLLYLALRDVPLGQVWPALKAADPGFVALALLSVALNVAAKAVRWLVLVGPAGREIGFGRVLMVLLAGQTINWFLPGRVGDLSRAYLVGGMGAGRSYTLGTVALEKVIDMLSYVLLFLFLLLFLPLPAWISESGYTFSLITAGITLGVILIASFPAKFTRMLERALAWLPERTRPQILGRVRAGLGSLEILRDRGGLLVLALLSAAVWGSAVWTNHLAARALGLRLPWTASLTVLILLQAGISLPVVPGRIGLFQYLCILALSFFGVEEGVGLVYGILLQAVVLIPTTLVSLPYIGRLGAYLKSSPGVKAADPGPETP